MTLLGLLFGQSIDAGTIAVVPAPRARPRRRRWSTCSTRTKGVTVKTAPTAAIGDASRSTTATGRGARVLTPGPSGTVSAQAVHLEHLGRPGRDHPGHRRRASPTASPSPPPASRRRCVCQAQSVDSASLSYIDFLLPGHHRPLDHDLGRDRPVDRDGRLARARHPAPDQADPDPAVGVLCRPDHRVAGGGDHPGGGADRVRPGGLRRRHLDHGLGGDPGGPGRLPVLPGDGLCDRLGGGEPPRPATPSPT